EEHWNVVAYDVPVALLVIQLNRESAPVTRKVRRSLVASHGRETDEDRYPFLRALEQIGARNIRLRFVILEIAMGAETARVYHALGNPLMIKMKNLLTEV